MTIRELLASITAALSDEFKDCDREVTMSDAGNISMIVQEQLSAAKPIYVCPECYKPFGRSDDEPDICQCGALHFSNGQAFTLEWKAEGGGGGKA